MCKWAGSIGPKILSSIYNVRRKNLQPHLESELGSCILPLGFHQFVFVAAFSQTTIMVKFSWFCFSFFLFFFSWWLCLNLFFWMCGSQVLQNDIDLLNPPAELEKRKHKLKRLVQSPNSFFMVPFLYPIRKLKLDSMQIKVWCLCVVCTGR